ncbi:MULTISPECIES: thiolase [unclassified Sphingobium]|uniref:thiolase n=1 Tax=unclassified Sphingobium TaxID=2611147 RepID=UPI000D16F6AB|nr:MULTISPECIES: thiolase [unclassified Sphingobium]MBG6120082.1 acetyl-CoA acetyltransferase [Sphingobium sp. JAI105]PSO12869.1 thiolase [Sphingobium sp. AEW4]TWD05717.1 acetyl-CoA acetyltransferase [Sphingobium sp. AEW010]TWD23270.1 acetyl-CoA acetyltransferase [Sphingobium sp. AEW013]TWD25130.1 acetyl-CoA acetyltransferase [Sphingobium sp. AEW001]
MSGHGFPRGKAAIVGASTYGLGRCPGVSAVDMAARASLMALADAGLSLSDVDAIYTSAPYEALGGLELAEYLGLQPKVTDCNRTGGSAFEIYVQQAALALEAGLIDCALIAYGANPASNPPGAVGMSRLSPWEAAYRPIVPASSYALAASRHMHLYGTTRRQLAEVAVAARRWAQLNPEAAMRDPLTIEDVLSARMLSDPLSVRDCCLFNDGAAAVVMVRADRARDCAKAPIAVLGAASVATHREINAMPDLTVTGAAISGPQAFAQAGISVADVDVAMLYDAFTITPILFLEDLGFSPKGEGGRFVEDGAIAPGGRLAVNTNGGGLSCVHPGMYGLFLLVEATRQLRGEAGDRQIADAQIALAHGNGGVLSSQATVVLGTSATL